MFLAKILRRVTVSLLIVSGIPLSLAVASAPAMPGSDENLPPLLEAAPSSPYEILTPLGAGNKDLLEARQQLRREGAKAQAEAIILLSCEQGGMGRDGMTFYRKDAYCRGLAIRYKSSGPVTGARRIR